jgi:hypothetical protein
MKKFKSIIFTFTLVLMLPLFSILVTSAQSNECSILNTSSITKNVASLDHFLVTIIGLDKGDSIKLTILPEVASSESKTYLEKTIVKNGTENATVDMSCSLEDGYYQMLLTTSDKYFCEPKGYFFMVYQSQMVNPCKRSALFTLSSENAFIEEPMISLSAPDIAPTINLSVREKTPFINHLDNNRHYFDYWSTLSVPGILARFAVTNPGVVHGGPSTQFMVDHIYAATSNGSIEIGWAEVSWQADTRYLFVWDSVNHTWYMYSTYNNPMQVRLSSSGTTWKAEQWMGSYWTQYGAAVDLGVSNASSQFNGGEMYSDDNSHPSLPSTTTDMSKLYISGSWVNWDWQRWATTYKDIRPSGSTNYGITTYTSYYNFSIYSN